MAEQRNHHFVPTFYFRNFSEDGARIHLLHRPSGRIIPNAPIKGQCAKHSLYGPTEMERFISQLEGSFSSAIRDAIHTAWNPQDSKMTRDCVFTLRQAVLFQRNRTIHEVGKSFAMMESSMLEEFKDHLRTAPNINDRERIIKAIEDGTVTLERDDTWLVMMLLSRTFEATVLITDLPVWLIRNHTDLPFLFGDAPIVLYNSHYRNVTSRGVLGLQTPGLQIFFPLDARTMLLMMDGKVYSGRCMDSPIVDVIDRSDVSQLNALQLHHSLISVYFGRERDAEYVCNLWNANSPNIVQSRNVFRVEEGWLLDGKPVDRIHHDFEPHLNLRLDLSSIECNPIRESEYKFSHRTPVLVQEYNRLCTERDEEEEMR